MYTLEVQLRKRQNLFLYLKTRLKKIVLNLVSSQLDAAIFIPVADSFWFMHPNFWEPNVAIALRDVLKPGDTFWDIGANVGGITRLGSRLVGPTGLVIAVEASLENYSKLHHNIIANNLSNVFGVRSAIWSESGKLLNLFRGDGGNDSLIKNDALVNGQQIVSTLTLDDLFQLYGKPNVIKIDIEGVELEALQGACQLLEFNSLGRRPVIILEQGNDNMSALNLLLKCNYIIQDLSTGIVHRKVPEKYIESISNWLALPKEFTDDYHEVLAPFQDIFCELDEKSNFEIKNLPANRYCVSIEIEPSAGENIYVCLWHGSEIISRYHGDATWLNQSYQSRQFDFISQATFKISIENPSGSTKPKSYLKSAKIKVKNRDFLNRLSYVIAP